VYDDVVPPTRTADAHDLVGTYLMVNDRTLMTQRALTGREYIEIMRARHARIMAGRPDKNPGSFKTIDNRAGSSTTFVISDLVEGTLLAGFDLLQSLDTAWERAAFAMFLVAEVHPFDDGNGRTARIMMNSELVAGSQSRIIIPTVFREDYLGGLRRLSRNDDPSVFIKVLRVAQTFISRIDFADLDVASEQLRTADAFEPAGAEHVLIMPPVSAERWLGSRLTMRTSGRNDVRRSDAATLQTKGIDVERATRVNRFRV
jgi:hypothetical protein